MNTSTKNTKQTVEQNQPRGGKAELILLSIDAHKNRYVVTRKVDGQSPQSPQRFSPERFLGWAKKQRSRAVRVVSCYEAGCFGYGLHRQLEAAGIENLVIRPRNWDPYGQRVKTDNRDSMEMLSNLDRYVAGNKSALSVVRVPSEQQERERSVSRQRQCLQKERRRMANHGQGVALYYGHSIPGDWWKPKQMATLAGSLPAFLMELLAVIQSIVAEVERQLVRRTRELEAASACELPTGLGALTATVLDREIGDWKRFKNRRCVSSYTGLVPGEDSSGDQRRQLSVTKHGNPRVRHLALEAAWRLFHFQPDYRVMIKWRRRIAQGPPLTKARKKKIAVAIARQFLVDWWRIRTGRTTPKALGLQMSWPAAPVLRTLNPALAQSTR